MRMKLLAAIGLAAALLAGPAVGADIYKNSTQDVGHFAEPSQPVNWTGFYVGGQGGWVAGSHELSLDTPAGTLFSFDGIAADGAIGGVRVGFDLARSRFLFGVFADYNWSNAETELEIGGASTALFEKDNEWTIGGRAGYLVAPRTLVYGLVGYTQSGFDIGGASFDTDGITAGGGVEFVTLGNIAFGLEASHTWYDDVTLASGGGIALKDELNETRVLGTLKLKLNSGLFGY